MITLISNFIIAMFYSNAYFTLWDKGILPITPMYWYIIIALASLMCIVFKQTYEKYNDNSMRMFYIWFLFYMLLTVVCYLYSEQLLLQNRTFKNTIYGIVLTLLLIPMIYRKTSYTIKTIFYVVIISVVINIIEIIAPKLISFTQVAGRAAGFYINPNNSGIYLVLGMVLTLPFVSEKRRGLYSLFVMVGTLLTFSRGGIIMWLLSFLAFIFMRFITFTKLTTISGLIITLVSIIYVFYVLSPTAISLNKYLANDALGRINFTEQESLKGRFDALKRGIQLIEEAPLLGHGLGAAKVGRTIVHPHNQYILQWVEQGLLGLLLYISLLLYLLFSTSNIRKIFAMVLILGSFFSHNILETNATWIAILLILSSAYDQNSFRPKSSAGGAGSVASGFSGFTL